MPTLSALTFLFALGLAPAGWAQTPNATVENKSGETALESSYSGGLLAPGKFGDLSNYNAPNDSIPASGAGTRMMWYPEKAAFRAGRVGDFKDGTQWDADSTGEYSVAFGDDTKASGARSMAVGNRTTASGPDATAMGFGTTAKSDGAVAMGYKTTAGNDKFGFGAASSAVAMGRETTASEVQATAMGFQTTASGSRATAMGYRTTASGADATAMGRGTEAATDRSLSLGECNSANRSDDGTLLAVGNGSYDAGDDNCSPASDALMLDDQGEMTIAGTLTENSDRRLKEEITPMGEGTLEALSELRPVRYEFKNQQTYPSGEQIGLIAQDVQEEFPSLVSKGSGGMLSLAYPKLTAVLLKGLQEQQSTIEEQNRRIDRLEKRLAALEQQNSSALPAGLVGPWALALLLGLGGLAVGLLWRRRS